MTSSGKNGLNITDPSHMRWVSTMSDRNTVLKYFIHEKRKWKFHPFVLCKIRDRSAVAWSEFRRHVQAIAEVGNTVNIIKRCDKCTGVNANFVTLTHLWNLNQILLYDQVKNTSFYVTYDSIMLIPSLYNLLDGQLLHYVYQLSRYMCFHHYKHLTHVMTFDISVIPENITSSYIW